jgi:hypothetical protein
MSALFRTHRDAEARRDHDAVIEPIRAAAAARR